MNLAHSEAEKNTLLLMEVSLGDTIIYYYLSNCFNETKAKLGRHTNMVNEMADESEVLFK